jgi:hypothetical protein
MGGCRVSEEHCRHRSRPGQAQGVRRFFQICPRRARTRANPKSREGRLRSNRSVGVVGDLQTADHDRFNSAYVVKLATGHAGRSTAGGVSEAAADAGPTTAGDVVAAAADAGPTTAGDVVAAAADAGAGTAGDVVAAAADAGAGTAGDVAAAAADAGAFSADYVSLPYDKAAESGLEKTIESPDNQVV